MALVLPRALDWINHRGITADGLVQQTVPATAIRFLPVSKAVTNARKEGAELVSKIKAKLTPWATPWLQLPVKLPVKVRR